MMALHCLLVYVKWLFTYFIVRPLQVRNNDPCTMHVVKRYGLLKYVKLPFRISAISVQERIGIYTLSKLYRTQDNIKMINKNTKKND